MFQSGTPYTLFDPKGPQIGEHNGARQPSYFQTDATIDRNIPLADIFGSGIGSSSLTIQLEILNLFNRTEALALYPTSGQADDDGVNPKYTGAADFVNDPTSLANIDQLGLLYYNARWDLNRDGRVSVEEQTQAYNLQRSQSFARRTNYQVPRRFYMNFTLHF